MPLWDYHPHQHFITTRRHPLAFASYVVTFLLGLLFLTGSLDTDAFSAQPLFVKEMWEAELTMGGFVGIFMLVVRPRIQPHWPDLADCLRLESIAAFVGGLGFVTYCVSLSASIHHFSSADVLLGVMGLGMIVRAAQALWECFYVEKLAILGDAAQSMVGARYLGRRDGRPGKMAPEATDSGASSEEE